ncbi:DJ-1/PfpI family protein [Solimicrobium silvestre]|uniref:Putative amidotransferase n=1 Tax=Solimicrobium silvestre TaxID=2099400 RepID=A0A2S9GSN7_9BURK|nr:DJ-1/PfpI family protein [Solimicrobium silvestre]PRC90723.1 putative amidotransferase [Solimicrobium silvestre]
MQNSIQIGFLLFPRVTQLDLTGPAQILSRVPNAKIHLVWKALEPVITDVGFSINPTTTFTDCPVLDVLCVPGGIGIGDQVGDTDTLEFLRQQAATAKYITSVCNGSLVLGAAGLLNGYKSACHWMWRKYLPLFGAIPISERVVRDRNRISGGGVTAGIDFAFTLVDELAGADVAKILQLGFEYDPQPPFECGSPESAGPDLVERVIALQAERMKSIEPQILHAALF